MVSGDGRSLLALHSYSRKQGWALTPRPRSRYVGGLQETHSEKLSFEPNLKEEG